MGNCVITRSNKLYFPDFTRPILTQGRQNVSEAAVGTAPSTGWLFGYYSGYITDGPKIVMRPSTNYPCADLDSNVTGTTLGDPVTKVSAYDYNNGSFLLRVQEGGNFSFWGHPNQWFQLGLFGEK